MSYYDLNELRNVSAQLGNYARQIEATGTIDPDWLRLLADRLDNVIYNNQ